jgi:hypothetical protein
MTIDLSKPLGELIVEISTNPRTAAQQMLDMQTRLNGRTYFHSNDAVERELAEVRAELAAARVALTYSNAFVRIKSGNMDEAANAVMAMAERVLSTPSSADKVQAVLEAAEEYINRLPHEIGPQMLMQSGVDKLYEAVRALREKG